MIRSQVQVSSEPPRFASPRVVFPRAGLATSCLAAAALALPGVVFAGANTQPGARLMAVVVPDAGPACTIASIPCTGSGGPSGFVSHGASAEPENVFIYIVATGITNLDAGMAGAQFGIEYDPAPNSGIDLVSWTSCAVKEYPLAPWPASGSGNTLAWLRDRLPEYPCPRATQMVVGYFSAVVHGKDHFKVIPHPATGLAKVADCRSSETWLDESALGAAGVGGEEGNDPCGRSIEDPKPVPGGEDPIDRWDGARLLMHAVSVDAAAGGACGYEPVSLCTNRATGQVVNLPDPGNSPEEYWVYVTYHDPHYESAAPLYEIIVGRLAAKGITPLEWVPCAEADQSASPGWPSPDATLKLRSLRGASLSSDLLLGAFRVRVDGPGYLKFGEQSRVERLEPRMDLRRVALTGRLRAGWIGVGNVHGNDPCPAVTGAPFHAGILAPPPATAPTTIQPISWGRLKTLVH